MTHTLPEDDAAGRAVLLALRDLPDVVELVPQAGSGLPEVAWGDHFFTYAPGGEAAPTQQPFVTIVVKDYPDDATSRLDEPGRWRLNVHVGKARLAELLADRPAADPSDTDAFFEHPVYGSLGWVAVVNPGGSTLAQSLDLVRDAHDDAVRRAERRQG